MPEVHSLVVPKGIGESGHHGLDARIQIKILQDDKLDLVSRISQMVSRSELLAARAEASARQGEVQALEQQLLKQRESIDGLNERLRSLQDDNSRMHVTIQVGDQGRPFRLKCANMNCRELQGAMLHNSVHI
jgi:hypothetical protein